MITNEQIKLIREALPMSRLAGDEDFVECHSPDCCKDGRRTRQVYDTHTFCHKCRVREDQIDFLQRTRHIDWVGAVRLAASMAGVPLEANKERTELLAICQVEFHKQLFLRNPEMLAELMDWRGWSRETIVKLNLGYSDPEGDALKRTGIPMEDLIELGFYKHTRFNDEPYFLFSDRYVFPIKNFKNQLVSMKGRLARHYSTEETDRRGKTLPLKKDSSRWGAHSHMDHLYLEETLDRARRLGYLVITEGEPNAVSLFDHQIPCVALQMNRGLAKFAHLLTRPDPKTGKTIQRIYVCLDNDEPTLKVIRQEMFQLQLALLPVQRLFYVELPYLNGPGQKLDVDEFFHTHRKNREDFIDLLKPAPDFAEWIIREWGRDLRNHYFLHLLLSRLQHRQDKLLTIFSEVTGRDVALLKYAVDTCRLDPKGLPAAA